MEILELDFTFYFIPNSFVLHIFSIQTLFKIVMSKKLVLFYLFFFSFSFSFFSSVQ
jgi:hypothetical protein